MKRFNKELQDKADIFAKENGYFCATYIGRWNNCFVFHPCYKKSLPRMLCFPALILLHEDGRIEEEQDLYSLTIMAEMKRRYLWRGRKLFKKYQEMIYSLKVGDEDREYAKMIVNACNNYGYDILIGLEEMDEYLENADRLNMKLDIKPRPETMDRNDGWEYYIELV